ncbi:hypothetical protein LWI29_033334 [Acer saccharum]|uniref:Inhibitor I9 domain-containing protein n=1 Tax=Acer saccharum TaxID=4024 RepID=A0AA39S8Z1_ACESA|nr:hypothetical protein LWI29_033334 [Acer saccharum]
MTNGTESKEEFLFGPWMRAFAPARRFGSGGRHWDFPSRNKPSMDMGGRGRRVGWDEVDRRGDRNPASKEGEEANYGKFSNLRISSKLERRPKESGIIFDSEIGGNADPSDVIANHRIPGSQELNAMSSQPAMFSPGIQCTIVDGPGPRRMATEEVDLANPLTPPDQKGHGGKNGFHSVMMSSVPGIQVGPTEELLVYERPNMGEGNDLRDKGLRWAKDLGGTKTQPLVFEAVKAPEVSGEANLFGKWKRRARNIHKGVLDQSEDGSILGKKKHGESTGDGMEAFKKQRQVSSSEDSADAVDGEESAAKRGIITDGLCPRCHLRMETVVHALWGCHSVAVMRGSFNQVKVLKLGDSIHFHEFMLGCLRSLTIPQLELICVVFLEDLAYIVYMGSKPKGQLSTSALHMSMLRQVAGRNFGPESLLYHYGKSFDGFVVKLTEEEANKMAGG